MQSGTMNSNYKFRKKKLSKKRKIKIKKELSNGIFLELTIAISRKISGASMQSVENVYRYDRK